MYALTYVKKHPKTTSAEFEVVWKGLVAANDDIVKVCFQWFSEYLLLTSRS